MLGSKNNIRFLACAVAVMTTTVSAMNLTHLSNIFLEPEFHFDKCFQLGLMVSRGIGTQSFNSLGCVGTPLQIWDAEQDALKMLQGFPADSAIGMLSSRINADDDGVRGHFVVNGCLDLLYGIGSAVRYQFYDDFLLSIYIPFYSMRLANVSWCNLTLDVTDQDSRVREYLTDNFFANVQDLGCLYLQDWKRTGFGDTIVLLEWIKDFPQDKPLVKNVNLNLRFGVSLPTGLKEDEDLIFAVPFGNDGAYGLPFGAGIELTLGRHMKGGVDVELLQLFGNSKLRRIKTDPDQTELLLLQKACTYKDWGLTQQFTLFGELFEFYKGLTFEFGYQYVKHGADHLSLETFDFSTEVANSATSLSDWTSHTCWLTLLYDQGYEKERDMQVKPQYALFAQLPFNGTRSALFSTVGAYVTIDF